MKRILIISIVIGVLALATILYTTNSDTELLTSDRINHVPTNITSANIPQDIASANNDFAINFYKSIYHERMNENIFFSPTSMVTAFSMLYEGAREDTATQMEDVFGFEPDTQSRHKSITELMSSLNRNDSSTLTMANALWIAKQYDLYESYIDTVRQVYLADVENVDFTEPDDGVKKINNWAAEKTNDKIKKVISEKDVNALTLAVLNNAIYFKGTWLTQFSKEDTMQKDFWTGKDVEADFMNIFSNRFNYTIVNGTQVLQLPYEGNRLSMLLILPNDLNGISDLEESLSTTMIKEWRDALYETDVDISIPKFEIKTKYELNDILIEMGMTDAFDENKANLSGIADINKLGGNIYVDKATQDAYVKVNEEGTEAAAVTTIIIAIEQESPPTPYFNANHPFLFLIQDDQSGAILFMGKIVDPTAE